MQLGDLWKSSSVNFALQGKSFIDSQKLGINSLEQAHRFLLSYGFNWDDQDDRKDIESIRLEALTLIQEELLTSEESIPANLLDESDVRQLLLSASGNENSSRWSCAILRVMHTLAHSQSYLNERYQQEIREQILSRFEEHITNAEQGIMLGDIPIVNFESRPLKSKRSVALKLLHKAENVAADIFDWIGIRIITHYRLDVMLVLNYLRKHNIIIFANVKPSRSRNTLLDTPSTNEFENRDMSYDELKLRYQEKDYPLSHPTTLDNIYSENSYRSIQLTCRQRIFINDPIHGKLRFFFPYEVQLIDQQSYDKVLNGKASHKEYKQRQKSAIRKRVLPHLSK